MLRSCRRQSRDRLLLERLGEPSSLPFAHEHPLAHSRAFFGVHETQARSAVAVEVNGRTVHEAAMPEPWQEYEFPLPGQDVHIGWNRVTFRFTQALRPQDLDPNSSDSRPLAARFRHLKVRSLSAGGLWKERPSGIEVMPVATAAVITMPVDATLEFYVRPQQEARLTGLVGAGVEDLTTGREVWASIELVEESGQTHQLLQYDYGASVDDRSFDIGLEILSNVVDRLAA